MHFPLLSPSTPSLQLPEYNNFMRLTVHKNILFVLSRTCVFLKHMTAFIRNYLKLNIKDFLICCNVDLQSNVDWEINHLYAKKAYLQLESTNPHHINLEFLFSQWIRYAMTCSTYEQIIRRCKLMTKWTDLSNHFVSSFVNTQT